MGASIHLGSKGLSIAEALELLRLTMPPAQRSLSWWCDMDYALAAAHLIDLSITGEIDTDIDTVTRRGISRTNMASTAALATLGRYGGIVRTDVVIEDIVSRIGDLRAGILATLQRNEAIRVRGEKVAWGFLQQQVDIANAREVALLKESLIGLIEGDALPSPEEAALISVLQASGIIADVLGVASPRPWLDRHRSRIQMLHRMDLVGQTVSATINGVRGRLHAYVLGAQPETGGKSTRSGALWEWRVFWPAEDSVTLPEALPLIGRGHDAGEEVNADIYLFLSGKRDNIKFRGKGLKVKPVIEAFDEFCAFGASGKVGFPVRAETLSGIFPRFNEVRVKLRTRDQMLSALSATGYRPGMIEVHKTRRQYNAILGVKIELAQIKVSGRMFHSLCLESKFLTALRVLSRHIAISGGIVGGYSEFLERVSLSRG
ncbi:GPP34 family phosphoprotein [Aestuariivirga sp.]|jgi:hypothetical protein|uniref:GPP34 family phosphoprotein n=1 Tax=Aestuariivirga sp. TaxID=2650926 RepID=UPI0037841F50